MTTHCSLRAVTSTHGMTVEDHHFDRAFMDRVATRISKNGDVNR